MGPDSTQPDDVSPEATVELAGESVVEVAALEMVVDPDGEEVEGVEDPTWSTTAGRLAPHPTSTSSASSSPRCLARRTLAMMPGLRHIVDGREIVGA